MTDTSDCKHTQLARDWIDDLFHAPGKHRLSDYVLTYDRDHIWDGYKASLLATKNRSLGCILVVTGSGLAPSVARVLNEVSLAQQPRISYVRAELGWDQVKTPAAVKWKVAAVDRITPDLAFCNLATLQSCILETSDRHVKKLISRFSRGSVNDLDWEAHRHYLHQFGLSLTEDQESKQQVAIAKARLRQ
jgi:hypothetical protein